MNNSPHYSVMLNEVLDALNLAPGSFCMDGTLGAGGHSLAILEQIAPDGTLTGFDLDPDAIAIAAERLAPYADRATIIHDSYANADRYLAPNSLDGALLDLGVSSMQLDRGERGFSFLREGPLDMRFDPTSDHPSAADLIAAIDEDSLADILFKYGEERASRRVAAAIIRERAVEPIRTTDRLAKIIADVLPRNPKTGHHPATKTFQALRIAVNQELDTVARALDGITKLLKPGGRFVILTFHSLEDRIVKDYFRRESTDCLCPTRQMVCTCGHVATLKRVKSKALVAGSDELSVNLRSRSAKLRIAEKIDDASSDRNRNGGYA